MGRRRINTLAGIVLGATLGALLWIIAAEVVRAVMW